MTAERIRGKENLGKEENNIWGGGGWKGIKMSVRCVVGIWFGGINGIADVASGWRTDAPAAAHRALVNPTPPLGGGGRPPTAKMAADWRTKILGWLDPPPRRGNRHQPYSRLCLRGAEQSRTAHLQASGGIAKSH